jgi:pimeloyl-ACP methyl ester carboxylesterase
VTPERWLGAAGGAAAGAAATYLVARRIAGAIAARVEDVDADTADLPGDRIFLRGRRIHLMLDGEGPPLLLIHGFAASAAAFRRLAPHLNGSFSLIAPDLPGFGFSARDPTADYSYEGYAALLFELLDRLGIERAAVLGHSIGAAIALRMAVSAPERVTRLVLAGGPGRVDPVLPVWLRPFAPVLVPALAANPTVQRWMVSGATAPGRGLDEAALRTAMAGSRVKGNAETLVAMLSTTRHGPPPDPAGIATPVLVLAGEHDRYFHPRRARRLAGTLARARVSIVPDAAHLLLEEQPERCAVTIRRFLLGQPPTSASAAGTGIDGTIPIEVTRR